jgi:hypothetical protein
MTDEYNWERDPARLNPTESALIGRGIDYTTAAKLHKDKWTVGKLQLQTDQDLKALGLANTDIAALRQGRPSIPFKSLAQVLWANRFTCCVCRESSRAIHVHHIDDWANSHDHDPSNLCVLCVEHHNLAHGKFENSQNLTPKKVKEFKKRWEEKVATLDSQAVLAASRDNSDAWVFFNHFRIFEVVQNKKIDLTKMRHFSILRNASLLDVDGVLQETSQTLPYMYDDAFAITRYNYMKEVWEALLPSLLILNVSNLFDRATMRAIVEKGDYDLVEGLHTFKRHDSKADTGRGQTVTGIRKTNNVTVEFVFDRWNATSCSAWAGWLSGQKDVVSIVRVGSISKMENHLKLDATVFAIAQGFSGFKTREYANAPYRRGFQKVDNDEDDKVDESWVDDDED